ncbi:MAG: sigma-70 family RNA polymerase sigma factor [Candidatus Eisenbacteria bacterium]
MEDETVTSPKGESSTPDEIRRLLRRFQAKDDEATSELLRCFYRELHAMAVQYMRGERPDHTLQPTALVNEAYIRLVGLDRLNWQGKPHFLGMAARTMRRILVDHARRKKAQKRGSGVTVLSLQDIDGRIGESLDFDLIDLDEALGRLERTSERQARIIDLRFFGGLSIREIAKTIDVSEKTVKNEIRFSIAWLRSQLEP